MHPTWETLWVIISRDNSSGEISVVCNRRMSVVFWISFFFDIRWLEVLIEIIREIATCPFLFRSKAFSRGEQTCRLSDRERSPLERRRELQHVLSTFTRYKNKHTLLFRRNSFLFSSQIFFKNIISLSSSTSTKNNSAITPNRRKILCTKDFAYQLYYCILYVPRVCNDFYRETMRSDLEVRSKHERWKFGIYHYSFGSATKWKRSADNKSDIVILRLCLSFNPSWALTRSCRATGLSNLLL